MVSEHVTTVAGSRAPGLLDGPLLQAQFYGPIGLAADPTSPNRYIVVEDTSGKVRLVDFATQKVSTLIGNDPIQREIANSVRFDYPCGVACDPEGTVYVGGMYQATNQNLFSAAKHPQLIVCGRVGDRMV